MDHTHGPCAALPVTMYTLVWVYCHHHQAWTSWARITRQEGEDVDTSYESRMDWGPFDTWDDIVRWLHVEFDHIR